MENKELCCCFNVTVNDIKEQIEEGVSTFKELQDKTKIGTSCPPCAVEAEKVFIELLNK